MHQRFQDRQMPRHAFDTFLHIVRDELDARFEADVLPGQPGFVRLSNPVLRYEESDFRLSIMTRAERATFNIPRHLDDLLTYCRQEGFVPA